MPYADEHDVISGMADVLDQAADAVSQGLGSDPSIRSEALGDFTVDGRPLSSAYQGQDVSQSGMGIGPGNIGGESGSMVGAGLSIDVEGGSETFTGRIDPRGDRRTQMGGGPSTDTMPQSIYGTPGGTAPDVTNLGDKPSIQALQAAIESGGRPTGGDPTMGGGPSDVMASVMGDQEAAEETSPGANVATFLSDFDRGMSAKSPEQGLVAKIDALQDQAASLQAMVAGDPRMGGGPQDIRNVMQPGAEFADPVLQGSYPMEQKEGLDLVSMYGIEEATRMMNAVPGGRRFQRGLPHVREGMGGGPSDLHEAPLGSYDYRAGRVNEPVPKSSMERLYETITGIGGSEMGIGGPDVPGMLRHDAGYEIAPSPHSTAMGTPNPAYLAAQAGPDISGVTSFEGTPVDQAVVSGGAVAPPVQDIAPKYSGQTVTFETHNQMYPNQKTFATMAGVSSLLSTIDGSHAGWIDAINKDMVARGIELTHEINGVKTGKHSSADWKEYSALFDPETGLDSNGVPMPGTARAPVEEVVVKPNLPDLSFLPPNFEDITPEQMARMERVVNEWRRSQQQAGQVNVNQAATVGDDTRGDHPVDMIRSTYTWAASLPNSVLFNAARYPDYLRLLIEYDAAGKSLPLTVPTWILEGTARPAEDEERVNPFASHPAMQTQELTWAT